MKKPYRKIASLVIWSTINILLAMIVALIPLFLCLFVGQNIDWLGIILFFAVWILLCIMNYYLFKKLIANENSKRLKYLILETNIGSIDDLLCFAKSEKIDDTTYLYVYNERMFNTISVFIMSDEAGAETIKSKRKKAQQYIRSHYAVAREKNGRKRHHELNVQLYAYVNEQFSDFNFNENAGQLLTIGFVECLWNVSDRKVIVPQYTGKEMEISALINYDKTINKLIKLFTVQNIVERSTIK